MVSSINRYKWAAIPLALIVLLAAFSPWLLPQITHDLLSGTDQGLGTVTSIVSPSLDQPVTDVGMAVHLCLDTPPLYPSSLAHEAASAIADEIDALIIPGFSGLRLYSSYIASKSYQDNTRVNFTIPPVPSIPPRPVQKHSPDPYKDALLRHEYETAVDAWQKQVNIQLSQLAALRVKVHSQTNNLRSLSFPFDDRGADYFSCLSEAASHVQDATSAKNKLILIASALVNNSEQEQGSLNLSAVDVKAVFFSCHVSAVACQKRVGGIKRLVLAAGAKSFIEWDVSESQAQQFFF